MTTLFAMFFPFSFTCISLYFYSTFKPDLKMVCQEPKSYLFKAWKEDYRTDDRVETSKKRMRMKCSLKWQDRQTLVTFMQTVSKVGAVTPECLFLILFSNKAAAFSNLKKSHLYLLSCIIAINHL